MICISHVNFCVCLTWFVLHNFVFASPDFVFVSHDFVFVLNDFEFVLNDFVFVSHDFVLVSHDWVCADGAGGKEVAAGEGEQHLVLKNTF